MRGYRCRVNRVGYAATSPLSEWTRCRRPPRSDQLSRRFRNWWKPAAGAVATAFHTKQHADQRLS